MSRLLQECSGRFPRELAARKRAAIAFLAAIVMTSACQDATLSPLAPAPASLDKSEFAPAAIRLGSPVKAEEQVSAELIARVVAVALNESSLRQDLLVSLTQSSHKEKKLHLGSFLRGAGAPMLRAGLARAGIDQSAFATAMGRVRDLEFYMPVEEHRRSWAGSPVLVAAAVTEDTAPIAYDGIGNRVVLDNDKPPAMPVLVVTPRETRFSLSPSNPASSSKLPAHSTSTRLLSPPTGPSMSMVGDGVIGLYASFIRLMDEMEPWYRGDPELEIIIVGRTHPDGVFRPYQCSGEYADQTWSAQPGSHARDYVYNQDGRFFSATPGPMLLAGWQLDHIRSWDPDGFAITFWEDDDTTCGIRERNSNETLRDWADVALSTGEAIRAKPTLRGVIWELVNWALASTTLVELLQGGDDYLGVAIEKSATIWAGSYPDNTHIIMRAPNEFAGRATLHIRQNFRTVSMSGPSTTGSHTTSHYNAWVTGATGALRFVWSIHTEGTDEAVVVHDGPWESISYTNSGTSFQVLVNVYDDNGFVGYASIPTWVTDCVEVPGAPVCPQ